MCYTCWPRIVDNDSSAALALFHGWCWTACETLVVDCMMATTARLILRCKEATHE